jgi:Skp family chaperone for outer membrane proteins
MMMLGMVTTALLAAGLWSQQEPSEAQSGGSGATTVAVVDLQAVFNASKQQNAIQSGQTARAEKLQGEVKTRQEEVQRLQSQLDTMTPNSDAWESKRTEVLNKSVELQAWAQVSEQLEGRQRTREFVGLYDSANKAVSAVANELGIAVVLQTGTLPSNEQLAQAQPQQLVALLQNRKVLHHTAQVDITQQVIARMNSDYTGQ